MVTAILWLSFNAFLNAQSFIMEPLPESRIRAGVQYLRPDYSEDADQTIEMTAFSGSYDCYLGLPISGGFNLSASLPVIIKASDGSGNSFASGVGNLYLGLRTRPDLADNIFTSWAFGVYLPTASNNRQVEFLGTFANFHNPQKALMNVLTFYGNYLFLNQQKQGFRWGFEGGPQVFIPVKAGAGSTELFVHYGITVGYRFAHIALGGEILGLANLTDSFDQFGERFDHSAALGAQLNGFAFRPGFFYEVVITDQNTDITLDVLNGVIGIRLEWVAD